MSPAPMFHVYQHQIARLARSSIGIVPQELNLDPFFTPFESVELQAGYYGIPKNKRRTDEILDAVKLSKQKHAYARALSGGMRRRLLVAKALVTIIKSDVAFLFPSFVYNYI